MGFECKWATEWNIGLGIGLIWIIGGLGGFSGIVCTMWIATILAMAIATIATGVTAIEVMETGAQDGMRSVLTEVVGIVRVSTATGRDGVDTSVIETSVTV